jgi:polyribonucleotide nucleotidyltransferase
MGAITLSAPFGATEITLETGRMAKLADGAVLVTMGGTMVLVTVCGGKSPRPGVDFLPLTCDYVEKMYAAGRIPGGYFKREGRLGPWEILVSRLIDRPNRPLFNKSWRKEIQIIATVLSADGENDPGICAMVGAGAACAITDIPYAGPAIGVRVAEIDGELKINPLGSELDDATLELIVAGTRDAVTMVEGEGKEIKEARAIDAIDAAHQAMMPVLDIIDQLVKKVGAAKQKVEEKKIDADLFERVVDVSVDDLDDATRIAEKKARYAAIDAAKKAAIDALVAEEPALEERIGEIKGYLSSIQADIVRARILEEGVRIDGRETDEIRAITCEVGVLPRTHGSALFTRGETQALGVVTLGSGRDEQRIDNLRGDHFEHFMLHYNFPPFCTGETKFLRGASRREIGHGNLAHRGVRPILPEKEDFGYTIRIVSEVLESNGSSSMATVCASSLALMDGAVPTKKAVAGIAMGLIKEGDDYAILSDILGDEDHLGDMDFKVVGTRTGITALQMDIKIKGLPRAVMTKALKQAREGRLHILRQMDKALKKPRTEMNEWAPKLHVVWVKPDKIRDIIGPGGKVIRGIQEQTGVSINVEDTGEVQIYGANSESVKRATEIIESLTQEPEVGRIYNGIVRKVVEFGAFVEILPGTDGLVHISELADRRVEKVEDILREGDEVMVKCIDIDGRTGKIRLSRREALDNGGAHAEA